MSQATSSGWQLRKANKRETIRSAPVQVAFENITSAALALLTEAFYKSCQEYHLVLSAKR